MKMRTRERLSSITKWFGTKWSWNEVALIRYKVKILFYIEELTKKAHIPRDFVHDAGKTWVCNLFCSFPPTECLLLGYFPDVFWVTTKFSLLTDG